jgi:hypothetical protein
VEGYIAIDPGETSGVAEFDKNGQLVSMHQFKRDDLFDYLAEREANLPETLIFEEYMVFAHKLSAHAWSKLETVQVIGALVFWCHRNGVKCVEQKAQAKILGYKYMGATAPKNHDKSHGPDAAAHGIYWLVNHKIIKSDLTFNAPKTKSENGA